MCNQYENYNCRDNNYITGEKCGTVTVSIYKETQSGSSIFHVQCDNENVLPVSNIIEDALTLY